MRPCRIAALICLVIVAAGFSGCVKIVPAEVAGSWAGQLTWAENDQYAGITKPLTLHLVQDQTSVSGQVELMGPASQAYSLPIISGLVRGNSISIAASGEFPFVSPPPSVSFTLEGECAGDEMSGTGVQTIDGEPHDFCWEVLLTSEPPPA